MATERFQINSEFHTHLPTLREIVYLAYKYRLQAEDESSGQILAGFEERTNRIVKITGSVDHVLELRFSRFWPLRGEENSATDLVVSQPFIELNDRQQALALAMAMQKCSENALRVGYRITPPTSVEEEETLSRIEVDIQEYVESVSGNRYQRILDSMRQQEGLVSQ